VAAPAWPDRVSSLLDQTDHSLRRRREYVGLVADDVDRIWGELVEQTATVNWHVPSARREVSEVAATMDESAQCAALLSAKGTGQ
jgi:hypothetical protein